MKQGEVVHLRLNAEDVMGCIDVVKQAGVYVAGMSLAQVARLALSGLLEAARKHAVIPRRDGFEYSAMLQPFTAGRTGRKLQITSIIESAEAARAALDLPASAVDISLASKHHGEARSAGAEDLFDELVKRKGRLLVKMQEMQFKMKADPLNFGKEEQLELDNIEQQIRELDGKLEELA